MKLSRWTIVAPVPGRDTTVLIQPLTGEAALIEAAQGEALQRGAVPTGLDQAELRQAGFVVESDDDDRRLLADATATFTDEAARTPTQLIVVPGFGCNLACTYCYQEPFEPTRGLVEPAVIDAFFAWVDRFHAGEDPAPYITLFGGEPLVDTPAHRDRVQRYLDGTRARQLSLAVVTNGYDLEAYVPILAAGPVREVQVTLDGPPAVHDGRRPHAGGGATFDRIVRGLDALVAAKIPINLRVVVDRANLTALPELARFIEAKGWLDLPVAQFKTQVGRNYELFGCAASQRRSDLFERAELWATYVELSEREPVLRRFYRPRFHGMAHLAETGELPAPNFDACPAAKKEWAFGPDGTLYGCTATVGNSAYKLGRFHPTVERDEAAIAQWTGRSTLRMDKCRDCNVAPMCGGGCGALAAARTGSPMNPDCRPVRELVGWGARYYGLDRLEDRSRSADHMLGVTMQDGSAPGLPTLDSPLPLGEGQGEGSGLGPVRRSGSPIIATFTAGVEINSPSPLPPSPRGRGATESSSRRPQITIGHLCADETATGERTGCLACGAELIYRPSAVPMKCRACNETHLSRARCANGHFYCDKCHAGSAIDAIERICLSSSERNPVALAALAMKHPKVNMHGPEHHFLAPAALLTAWCNVTGQEQRKAELLAEARKRAQPVLGGFCGFQGTCGAGVGTGIFVSLVTDATPLKGPARGMSIRMTSAALDVIGRMNGARCCKRDTFLALLSAARFARANLGIELPARGVKCEFHTMNRECMGDACPFHRKGAQS
jgi:uncharacterized protein